MRTFVACALLALPGFAQESFRFGPVLWEVRGLAEPCAVDFDAEGSLWVLERAAGRVRSYGTGGELVRELSADLLRPEGLCTGEEGRVWVADTGNHRVVELGPDGRVLRALGERGTAPGAFFRPSGVDLAAGRLVVADTGNHRVQVIDLATGETLVFGGWGREEGRLRGPRAVALDDEGHVWCADTWNHRVQVFGPDGLPRLAFGEAGPWPGLFSAPTGIELVGGRAIVVDRDNHRVQAFDGRGDLEWDWGVHALRPRESGGKLHYPVDVAVAPDRSLAVLCEAFEDRLQAFGPDEEGGGYAMPPLDPGARAAAHYGEPLDVDRTHLVLLEPETATALLYDARGDVPVEIAQAGGLGSGAGELCVPSGAELDVDALTLVVADRANRTVQRFRLDFDPTGETRQVLEAARFARAVDLGRVGRVVPGPDGGPLELERSPEPGAVERRPGTDELFVLDLANERVLVLGPDLLPKRSFGGHGTEPGRLRAPADLAFDAEGTRLWVSDADNHRIQALDPDDGRPLASLAAPDPAGLCVGPDGRLWATDRQHGFVTAWGPDGTPSERFGGLGIGGLGVGRGELRRPGGLGFDARGRLVVCDHGNHRGQLFEPDGTWLGAFGSRLFVRAAQRDETGEGLEDGAERDEEGAR